MVKLLVTGGAGLIGSNFVRQGVRRSHEIRVLDRLTYVGNRENLRPLLEKADIEFPARRYLRPLRGPRIYRGCDAVVRFAAETHVDRSILEGRTSVQTDVYGA